MSIREAHRRILNRARGYGALARWLLSHRRDLSRLHRPRSLAAHITARYALLQRRWPAMALVYQLRDEQGVVLSQTQLAAHTSILVTPRLLLSMLVTHQRGAEPAARNSVATLPIGRVDVPRTLVALRDSEQPMRTQPAIVERIVRRTVRSEWAGKATWLPVGSSGAPEAMSAPGMNERATASPVLGMVYRSNAPMNHQRRAAVTGQAESESPRRAAAVLRHAPAAAQTPTQIAQITDQVLQALDRRIVAQRERMGRV
jgi:hypothetical protein